MKHPVYDNVTINIPTVRLVRGENIKEENEFWNEVSLFTVSPEDMVVAKAFLAAEEDKE